MNIGKPLRKFEVKPDLIPVPEHLPEPKPEPVPAKTREGSKFAGIVTWEYLVPRTE